MSFGIKLFELCTCSGITLDFFLNNVEKVCSMMTTTMKQCQQLNVFEMYPYLYKNHILFTDNFYMSLNPAEIFLGHIVAISAKLLKITVSIFVRRLLMSRWKKEKYRSTDQQITTKSLFQSTEQQRTKVITNKKLCMYSTYNFLFCHSAKRCQSHKQ